MGQDTVDQNRKILLVDGYSMLNRAFYGLPDLTNAEGKHTGAVFGFLNILFRMLDEEKPAYLAVAFDVHAPTFRHRIYDAYKGTRKPMPDELREQVPLLKEVLDALGIARVEQEGLEADDILGTIAKRAQEQGITAAILSGDRDLLQVADEKITIVLPRTKGGKTEITRYTPKAVQDEFGVTPAQFIELKALQGDSSDNIPGVPKVGEKTARELMETYGSIEAIYANLEAISKKSIRESLRENRALCDLSKDLATIRTDSDISFAFDAACLPDARKSAKAYELFKRLGFRQLLSRFDKTAAPETADAGEDVTYLTVATRQQADDLFAALAEGERAGYAFVYDTAPDGNVSLLGLAVCGDDGAAYFLPAKQTRVLTEQMTLFDDTTGGSGSDADGKGGPDADGEAGFEPAELGAYMETLSAKEGLVLSAFDVKHSFRYYTPREAHLTDADAKMTDLFDILIAAYVLNPLKNDYMPEDIAQEHLQWTFASAKERFDKTPLSDVAPDALAAYACDLALMAFRAHPVLREKLETTGQLHLFTDIEMPLSYILYDMERIGVICRQGALKAYGDSLTARIAELEEAIHKAAGEAFNINSPKQLGEILFEKMGLQGGKKTKTGYSTAADVLEKLAEDTPMVRDVLEYRGLTKLKSTYADGLAAFIREDGRIHTVFNQTITATGRLSSSEPNLQNIPMRTDLGRAIRKVFVPEEGCVFVDADYSQIELRILAHMSDDRELIEAYHTDKDIHAITASKVFHVPFDQVTPLMRRNAKAVNFGIVYGISAFGLGNDLSISRAEASQYMKQYFATYPGVKTYQETAVTDAKKHGYSVTLYGRRRPVPELKSSNFMQRSFGERVAMNAPIQGTAADIMKIAMIRVWRRLRRDGITARMILQIHDELLIEAPVAERQAVEKLLEEEMKASARLKVPLEVEAHSGSDWYEAK